MAATATVYSSELVNNDSVRAGGGIESTQDGATTAVNSTLSTATALPTRATAVETAAVESEQVELARRAWRRYGKGRHPAALNFGDCFSYALSVQSGQPLLFKGRDFAHTDVVAALPG